MEIVLARGPPVLPVTIAPSSFSSLLFCSWPVSNHLSLDHGFAPTVHELYAHAQVIEINIQEAVPPRLR